MKKIKIITALTLLLAVNANSQITKGNWMVGGDLNYSNFKSSYKGNLSSESNSLIISPNIGYFFSNNFVIGIKGNFGFVKQVGSDSSKSIIISPFLRYYFLKPEKLVNVFIDASYGYGIGKTGNDDVQTSKNYNFKAGPVVYFNSSVGLELAINYGSSISSTESKYDNLSLSLGFQIHLEK